MKTKRIIYFICIVIGAIFMGFGTYFVQKEIGLIIGVVFLFYGVYKSSYAYGGESTNEDDFKQ